MKKILNILTIALSIILFQGCDFEEGLQDFSSPRVSFGNLDQVGVDVNGTATATVSVYSSSVLGTAATFTITADGTGAGAGSYTVPASVTIPAGSNVGTIDVILSDTNLGIGINQLVISVGSTATTLAGDPITISYVQNCAEATGTVALTFDRWGSEVSWAIHDSLGGLVTSGGGYGDTGAGTSTSDTIAISLCQGRSYTFTTTDVWGDGWGAVGNYTLTVGGVVKVQGDGSLMNVGGGGVETSSTVPFDTL